MLSLRVVALGPIQGYAIAERIRQISRDGLQVMQGSLYPALHRLENEGLLVAEWQQSDTGREAKFDRLTPRVRAQSKADTANWTRSSKNMALFLQAAEGETA